MRRSIQLVGRGDVQETLEDQLGQARNGRARAVTVEGEAGSGKTVLLHWLVERAEDAGFRVVTARPVEGESDLPLAVMTDVLRPLLATTRDLAAEHRNVLSAAAGGVGTAAADRLLLGAATLALVAAAAEEQPLLIVVDDAHWVDETSGQALGFAARRLLADRVATVVARRPVEHERLTGHHAKLVLSGLTDAGIRDLLADESGVCPPAAVVDRVRSETSGNPLAVSHLARRLTPDVLVGDAPLPDTLPLKEVAQRTFAGLVRALDEPVLRALSILAAAGSAAAQLVPEALEPLRCTVADLEAAEAAGLLDGTAGTLGFAHPLYRAAVVEVVGPAAMRRAHAALGEVARGRDLQRHAWHRGLSQVGADEPTAAVLDAAADAADRRAGAGATVGLRELALTLTPAGPARDRRLLAAARALIAAGRHVGALRHLDAVLDRAATQPSLRADAFHERARLMLWDTPLDTQPVADAIPEDLPSRQRSATLAVAALRARNAGEFASFGDHARAALAAMQSHAGDRAPSGTAGPDVAETLTLLPTLSLVAESELIVGSHGAPEVYDLVRRVGALLDAARGGGSAAAEVTRGLVAMLDDLAGSPAQTLIWTPALDLAGDLLALWSRAARARPSSLVYLLMARTELCGWIGEPTAGLAAADRAIELAHEVGSHALAGWTHVFAARICATQGDENGCREHGDAATEIGARLSQPGLPVWAIHARAHLELSTGRAEDAVETMDAVAGFMLATGLRGVRIIPWQPDHIEAMARAGRTSEAEELLGIWVEQMPDEPDAFLAGLLARCRVLVHGEEALDDLLDALDGGALAATPLEQARARLVAGTALRRRRRPAASRSMLDRATAEFNRMGAVGWAATARVEPAGRGRHARAAGGDGPRGDGSFGLTHQEMRVAQEIVLGATNREAAGRLFCSPKTIEYHLTHVYAKLGVRSRAALAGRLSTLPSS